MMCEFERSSRKTHIFLIAGGEMATILMKIGPLFFAILIIFDNQKIEFEIKFDVAEISDGVFIVQ